MVENRRDLNRKWSDEVVRPIPFCECVLDGVGPRAPELMIELWKFSVSVFGRHDSVGDDGRVGSQRVMDGDESDLCEDGVDDSGRRLKVINDGIYDGTSCREFVKSMCVWVKSLICRDAGNG